MNIALIMAGGLGQTLLQDIPKQFLNVFDKPIIVYALEAFQKHPQIDQIVISCLDGWQEMCKAYARQFGITKLELIVTGGIDGQTSVHKGVDKIKEWCNDDDMIVIHDAIRPMITQEIIQDCIDTCKKYNSGVAAIRSQEPVIKSRDGIKGNESLERTEIMKIQTPQAYPCKKLLRVYKEAEQRGITGAIYVNTIMTALGEDVYFSKGSDKNLKILTLDDLDIFKALCMTEHEEWIKKGR
ncbi:MAG: IspD/TarI family cytidylyltransferase [Lachnospiraceae bacterium]